MTSQGAVLRVSYDLHPPSSASTPTKLSSTAMHEFPLQVNSPGSGTPSSEAYYAALRDAVAAAKDVTGKELTDWRDAVGDGEKDKTGGKEPTEDEAEEEEEEEEEGEEEPDHKGKE